MPEPVHSISTHACGMLLADSEGLCTYTDPRWDELLSAAPGDSAGEQWLELVHPDDRTRVRQVWFDSVRRRTESSCQFRTGGASNGLRELELHIAPLISADQRTIGYLGMVEDVSQNERENALMLQSQKMEAVGRLAGGLAHDFANLLTLISGYSEIVLNRMRADDAARPEIEEIRNAANRGFGLTGQFLAFTRRQEVEPQVLDLNVLVLGMEKMLRRMIGEDLELITDLQPDLGRVKVDAGQMEQVIMNLVINGRDAMPGGGAITVRTANVDLGRQDVRECPELTPGPYVLLTFSDSGHGMDRETMLHIFEPFFTTKARGKGTGLGLTTVYSIVKQSNGHVVADSEPGNGTTFRVYLPRVEETVQPVSHPATSDRAQSGTETILVVEDEAAVRRLLKHVLTRHGYTVLEAGDGLEALQVYKDGSRPIDLLLTDIVMPRMGGPELAERMLHLQPELKVLFMSGYTGDVLVRTGALRTGSAFLQKPLKPEVLVGKVREALDQHTANAARAPLSV